ncbi:hypothetical protein BGZ61DRAFT_482793 [Ilyonectria robusta]|uniref:uncharacterized protein n=1 Tax=Ilyonectria robusta TaxID=1079257 RepID=UPI001E8EA6CE|nr:uncharacterized protein BGZ61DRAFT_482793 [Ilyonectria robusta]KAH8672461.1 hypothetical protein BGZ61DRAFT_482793 [Ilyonectria robusta]
MSANSTLNKVAAQAANETLFLNAQPRPDHNWKVCLENKIIGITGANRALTCLSPAYTLGKAAMTCFVDQASDWNPKMQYYIVCPGWLTPRSLVQHMFLSCPMLRVTRRTLAFPSLELWGRGERYIYGLYEVNIETAKSCHSNDKVCKYMIWKISGEQLYCKASVSSGAGCITKLKP